MKKNIAIYLKTLFPKTSLESFEHIELLGQATIRAMINQLKARAESINNDIEAKELLLKSRAQSNDRNEIDTMEIMEIASYIAHCSLTLGHYKKTTSNLVTVLTTMQKQQTVHDICNKPMLPTLRNKDYFELGEDVMIYIGETEFYGVARNTVREDFISPYKWICGKVLAYDTHTNSVDVFANNPVKKKGVLKGHHQKYFGASPLIFRRKDFFAMREFLEGVKATQRGDEYFISQIMIDFDSSVYRNGEKKHFIDVGCLGMINKIILDPNIEDIDDSLLFRERSTTLRYAVRVAEESREFIKEAREMCLRQGVSLPRT